MKTNAIINAAQQSMRLFYEKNPFCRDDDSDSEDDYADIYQGLSFGRKLPLKTVQVIINYLHINLIEQFLLSLKSIAKLICDC